MNILIFVYYYQEKSVEESTGVKYRNNKYSHVKAKVNSWNANPEKESRKTSNNCATIEKKEKIESKAGGGGNNAAKRQITKRTVEIKKDGRRSTKSATFSNSTESACHAFKRSMGENLAVRSSGSRNFHMANRPSLVGIFSN
ncbi:MAG: hypothetical protein MHMPM18_003584 [Marteilia pararefringens]